MLVTKKIINGLGVSFDSTLSSKHHFDDICTYFNDALALRVLNYNLVHSKFEYASLV
jgi:hypothetical protein